MTALGHLLLGVPAELTSLLHAEGLTRVEDILGLGDDAATAARALCILADRPPSSGWPEAEALWCRASGSSRSVAFVRAAGPVVSRPPAAPVRAVLARRSVPYPAFGSRRPAASPLQPPAVPSWAGGPPPEEPAEAILEQPALGNHPPFRSAPSADAPAAACGGGPPGPPRPAFVPRPGGPPPTCVRETWRPRNPTPPEGTLHSLEAARHHRWVLALEDIAGRLAPRGGLFESYPARVRSAVLGQGRWRTLRGHVLRWRQFERWARQAGRSVFPPSPETVLEFAAARADRGSSCVGALRSTLRFFAARLEVTIPAVGGTGLDRPCRLGPTSSRV